MMKKIVYTVFLALLILCGSCEKYLDKQPISDLSTDKFWKKATDIPLGMAGVYDGFQLVSGGTQNGSFLEWGDSRSDNLTSGGSGLNQINLANNALNSGLGVTNWVNLYRTIAKANVGIKYIPTIPAITDRSRDHYLSQLYAIRAYMYFYIIRLWGDAPLWTEPYEDINEPTARIRTPVAEIISKVILPDLLKAEAITDAALGATALPKYLFEVNIGTILAMQTEVYMYQKDYPKALAAANKLIALNRYALAPTASWKQIFTAPGTTKENIFNIYWDYTKDNGGFRGTQLIGSGSADAMFQIDNATDYQSPVHLRFQAQRAQGDIRAELTYDARLTASNARKIGKYVELRQPYPQTSQFLLVSGELENTNWPVFRYADILLLKAEALNQIGGATNRTEALALVNQIRARAGLTTPLILANYPTTKDLETVILDERQIELFCEGKRWFDLLRTGRTLEVMDPIIRNRETRLKQVPQGFTDPKKILYPINKDAIQANSLLTQNAPWQ